MLPSAIANTTIRQTEGFTPSRTPARNAARSSSSGTPPDTSWLRGDQALMQAADIVRSGRILALKGLGGFQLIVDARNESAVGGFGAGNIARRNPLR